jgi:hypothetical protein
MNQEQKEALKRTKESIKRLTWNDIKEYFWLFIEYAILPFALFALVMWYVSLFIH